MDPNYSLPESFSLERTATIRSLPSKAIQEHCCIRFTWASAGMLGVGMQDFLGLRKVPLLGKA